MATAVTQQSQAQGLVLSDTNDVRKFLENNIGKVFSALPKHMTPERMIRIVCSCVTRNPKLLQCKPITLINAVVQASSLGLEPDGVLGQAYLVAYKDEVVLIPGYRGLLDLVRRSGQVQSIHWDCVYDGDRFDYEFGDRPFITHKPASDVERLKKPITHVYVIVWLKGGGIQRSVWSRQQIDAHKERFSEGWKYAEKKGRKDSPWHTDWPAMAKKTVLRDMVKLLPVSVEIQRFAETEIQYDSDTVEAEPIEVRGVADMRAEVESASAPEVSQETPSESDGYLDSVPETLVNEYLVGYLEATKTVKTLKDLSEIYQLCQEHITLAEEFEWAAGVKDRAEARIREARK